MQAQQEEIEMAPQHIYESIAPGEGRNEPAATIEKKTVAATPVSSNSGGFFVGSSVWDDAPFAAFIEDDGDIEGASNADVDGSASAQQTSENQPTESLSLPALPTFSIFTRSKAVASDSEHPTDQAATEGAMQNITPVVNDRENGSLEAPPEAAAPPNAWDLSPAPTRVTVVANSSRFWSAVSSTSAAIKVPRQLFFDNVDDVNLDEDPILKQVKENKKNPNRQYIPTVFNDFLRPFRAEPAPSSAQNSSAIPVVVLGPSAPDTSALADISWENVWQWILRALKALLAFLVCAATVAMQFLVPLALGLWSWLQRLCVQLSARVNARGERMGWGERASNVGWFIWSYVSRKAGLGERPYFYSCQLS